MTQLIHHSGHEDLDVLQNDLLAPPIQRSILPPSMSADLREWLKDSYGPIEREDKMAPENQVETEYEFLKALADGEDPGLAATAASLLGRGPLAAQEQPRG